MVVIPKKIFTFTALAIVKKWCNHTVNERNMITAVAYTSDLYPNNFFLEKVETTSEYIPKAGRITI